MLICRIGDKMWCALQVLAMSSGLAVEYDEIVVDKGQGSAVLPDTAVSLDKEFLYALTTSKV